MINSIAYSLLIISILIVIFWVLFNFWVNYPIYRKMFQKRIRWKTNMTVIKGLESYVVKMKLAQCLMNIK